MYKIKEVSKEEFTLHLDNWLEKSTREEVEYLGFYYQDEKGWIGGDNTEGHFWCETFKDKETCVKWLKHEIEMDDF